MSCRSTIDNLHVGVESYAGLQVGGNETATHGGSIENCRPRVYIQKYHAACKVEFQLFNRLYSQLTFLIF